MHHHPSTVEGVLRVGDADRFAIVASRFNHFIVDRLVEGAVDELVRHGAQVDNLKVVKVPGAWEIPLAAKKLAEQKRYRAIVALGALIRGSTPHFDYISSQVSSGLQQVSLSTGVPAVFGVLTTDTIEQAIERAGTKAGNKGGEAALAAVEMANLLERLEG
ncbi:MAG: 6,7-dimethyl-8-ribityllumazine synthase [Myxococcota bacterium]